MIIQTELTAPIFFAPLLFFLLMGCLMISLTNIPFSTCGKKPSNLFHRFWNSVVSSLWLMTSYKTACVNKCSPQTHVLFSLQQNTTTGCKPALFTNSLAKNLIQIIVVEMVKIMNFYAQLVVTRKKSPHLLLYYVSFLNKFESLHMEFNTYCNSPHWTLLTFTS